MMVLVGWYYSWRHIECFPQSGSENRKNVCSNKYTGGVEWEWEGLFVFCCLLFVDKRKDEEIVAKKPQVK